MIAAPTADALEREFHGTADALIAALRALGKVDANVCDRALDVLARRIAAVMRSVNP